MVLFTGYFRTVGQQKGRGEERSGRLDWAKPPPLLKMEIRNDGRSDETSQPSTVFLLRPNL